MSLFHKEYASLRTLGDVTSACWNYSFPHFLYFFGEKVRGGWILREIGETEGRDRSFCNYFRFRVKRIVDCTWCASVSQRDSFTAIQPSLFPINVHLSPTGYIHFPWLASREISRSPGRKGITLPFFEFACTLIVTLFHKEQRTRSEEAFQESPFSLSFKRSDVYQSDLYRYN